MLGERRIVEREAIYRGEGSFRLFRVIFLCRQYKKKERVVGGVKPSRGIYVNFVFGDIFSFGHR